MNNFDMSSTGTNIELFVYYDCEEANEIFDMSINRISNYFYSYDFDCEYLEDILDLSKFSKLRKQEIKDFWECLSTCDDFCYRDKEPTKQEYIDSFKNQHISNFTQFGDIDALPLKSNIQLHTTRGYSQGDTAHCFYLDKQPNKAIESHIDNIFWDVPIRIRLVCDDYDLDGHELDLDLYEWDKEKFLDIVDKLDINEYAKNWIRNNTPEKPDYL